VVKQVRGWVQIKTAWHRAHGDTYEFELRRADTPLKLLEWLHHLSEKCWFDWQVARELIELVGDHYGWPWRGGG
jgi:hypothetical protein